MTLPFRGKTRHSLWRHDCARSSRTGCLMRTGARRWPSLNFLTQCSSSQTLGVMESVWRAMLGCSRASTTQLSVTVRGPPRPRHRHALPAAASRDPRLASRWRSAPERVRQRSVEKVFASAHLMQSLMRQLPWGPPKVLRRPRHGWGARALMHTRGGPRMRRVPDWRLRRQTGQGRARRAGSTGTVARNADCTQVSARRH